MTLSILSSILFAAAVACAFAWAASLHLRLKQANDSLSHMVEAHQKEMLAAGDALRELTDEYQSLVDGCGAGVIVLDKADNILQASEEAVKQLGAGNQAQLEGRSLLQLTLSAELMVKVKDARTSGDVERCEIRLGASNGPSLSVTIVPVNREAGRCLVISQDVTELRRLETVRRDFVANVSHELRTPLTSIRAMAETLQDGALADGEVADKFLGTISTEAQRLTRISEDLLILSHAESNAAEHRRFSLSSLAEDVCTRLSKHAAKQGLQLTAAIEPGLTADANPDQIEQVLINLIDNGIKYTPEGGSIKVTAEPRGTMLAVSIKDTGIGIMSQDLPRIFERFYRVDKARSRASGGTGLGLSIVKHIVEAHGGQVTVESVYNHGSVFTFTLPAV
jgi:two-component system, OmpR family, phosphate regulon sensor histidine kinase PhoR